MNLQPYLFFGGRCEEALAFYQRALGAELTLKMYFKDSPDAPPPGVKVDPEQVMHAELAVGTTTLMCSDGGTDDTVTFGGFSLAINADDEAHARRIFDALATGGQVTMPLGKTFWSPCFGMLSDRYGVGWMVGVQS